MKKKKWSLFSARIAKTKVYSIHALSWSVLYKRVTFPISAHFSFRPPPLFFPPISATYRKRIFFPLLIDVQSWSSNSNFSALNTGKQATVDQACELKNRPNFFFCNKMFYVMYEYIETVLNERHFTASN